MKDTNKKDKLRNCKRKNTRNGYMKEKMTLKKIERGIRD